MVQFSHLRIKQGNARTIRKILPRVVCSRYLISSCPITNRDTWNKPQGFCQYPLYKNIDFLSEYHYTDIVLSRIEIFGEAALL